MQVWPRLEQLRRLTLELVVHEAPTDVVEDDSDGVPPGKAKQAISTAFDAVGKTHP